MTKLAPLLLILPLLSGCFITTSIVGNGKVTSPSGHDCGSNSSNVCQKEYLQAGSETFTAHPEPGQYLQKWEGCDYVDLETCQTASWTQDMADNGLIGIEDFPVKATFEARERTSVEAAQYTYNALGQRLTKTVNGKTTVFQYDLDGNLMAEIDAASGIPIRQHIHLNGQPIAQLSTNPNNQNIAVQYVHVDHLGTPTLLTDQGRKVVADIESTPFGETYIDYAEVGHHRRFPGQYKDEETGLHYNYFREL